MEKKLPESAAEFVNWTWTQIEPYYQILEARSLDAENIQEWLKDWSRLTAQLSETYQRLYVATTVNTADEAARQRYNTFLDEIYPASLAAEQRLKQKLLNGGIEPPGFDIPLRNMRAEAALFHQENLPLLSEELKLSTRYDEITGAQTVNWDGQELTIYQVMKHLEETDGARRERAWRAMLDRQMADRQAIDELWSKFMSVRSQLAQNAGYHDYRAYRWQQLQRFDYTPEDCLHFHEAIEQVVVPVRRRLYEKRRQRLGIQTLRPWDLHVDPSGLPPLHPFTRLEDLEIKTGLIFNKVDPQLAEYYDIMRQENLLDLENRKNKAPGGYCTEFAVIHRPFIFMNAVGIHDDVLTLLHEGGHAFHVFESAQLPTIFHMSVGLEFAEVASTSMELLSAPYLDDPQDGFYTSHQAAQARLQSLENSICFWPYMAVVDAFQHWVYENHTLASNPQNCDAKWAELWDRYMVGEDWDGLEEEKKTGWHRKLHIHTSPFYYIEYGLALSGAVQVWRNAINDQAKAVADYRRALALGGTVPLPELYATAGARLAFDAKTLQEVVELMENTMLQLEGQIYS